MGRPPFFQSKNSRNAAPGSGPGHQALADEKGVDARGHISFQVGPGLNPRGGHQGHPRRRQGGQLQRPVRKHLEGVEIPGVDADHPGPGGQRGLHFRRGVHLHQGLQPQGVRQEQQGPELSQFQQTDDEQQGVGPQRRGFIDLYRLHV